jgi:predicted nucleic acid-binding protein
MFLSVISLHELEVGAALMQHRDPMQGAALQHWLQHLVLPSFEGRILPLTEAIAIRSAHLHVPDPRSYRDAFIAATAYIHKLAIVTRNVRDFKSTGVNIINPWTPQQP